MFLQPCITIHENKACFQNSPGTLQLQTVQPENMEVHNGCKITETNI